VTEVAGVPDIGMIGRGEDAEITTYLEKAYRFRAVGQRQ
jgi:NADH-quinone oxidoreductase subunit G